MKTKNLFSSKLRSKLEKLGKEVDYYRLIAQDTLNELNKAHAVAKIGSWKWYINENRVEWSDEMYRIFGVDKAVFDGDLTGIINSRIHPDDRTKVEESNSSVSEDGKPVAVDYRIILPDGTVKTVWAEAGELIYDSESRPSVLTGIVKDITEYVNLRQDLLQAKRIAGDNENKYRMFIDQTTEGVYLLEVNPPVRSDMPLEELVDHLYENCVLTECNNSFVLMYGAKNKNELIGKKLQDFHGGKDDPVNRVEMRKFVRNGFRTTYERTVEKDSEGKLHFFSNASIGIIQDDHLVRIWGTQSDVTNLFEKEAELIKAKERAEESDRLKTAFLNNMSHEIRTPLNGIVGFSQLLATPKLSDEKREEFAGMVSKCSEKLIDIISDVTEMSKIQANDIVPEYSEFDLNASLTDILAAHSDEAKRKSLNIRFTTAIPGNQSFIRSDKHKVEKIFSHLIRNAVKFTRKGFVEVSCACEKQKLIVTIKDSGIGIPSSLLSVIFEPFRQFESEGGNGLGLAIVKAYVEALGGEISVQSERGSGTIFITTLPVQSSDHSSLIPSSHGHDKVSVEETVPGFRRILIAEDENINFIYLKELLQSDNTEIIRASNGKEAVDICRENEDIDLILMDFMMPVMDGRSAAIKIKDFRPGLPIILQTAYSIDNDNTDINVFDDYIPKPIKSEVLKQKLNRFVSL